MKKTWLLIGFCFLFFLSLTFPITAAATNISSSVIAYSDVLLALILVGISILIHIKRSSHKRKGSRKFIINLFKILFSIPIILLVLFLMNLKIKWDVLLIGFAWRFWLLSLIIEDLVQIHLSHRGAILNNGTYEVNAKASSK